MRIGRNDQCPCGSGKKFKNCCQDKAGSRLIAQSASAKRPATADMAHLGTLFNAARYAELEILALKLIQQYSDSGYVWKALGASLHMQGKDPLNALQKAAALLPDDVDVHYNLGCQFLKSRQLPEAEKAFLRTLKLKPDFAIAHFNLGNLFLESLNFPKAEAAFLRTIGLKPDFVEAFFNLGYLFHKSKRLPEAEAAFLRAIELKPDFAEAHINLSNLLLEMRRLPEAEAAFLHLIALKPDFAEARFNLGNLLLEMRRLPQAEAALRHALKLKPDYAEAHNNLGNLLKEVQRLPEAESALRRALELKPDYAEAYNNLGNLLREMMRLPEAEAAYLSAIEFRPNFAEARCNLGMLFKEAGNLAKAEAEFRHALAFKPDYAEAFYSLGTLFHDSNHLPEAEAAYLSALELKPDYVNVLNNLGMLLQESMRLTEAESLYHRALELKADYAEAHNNLGMLLQKTKRLPEAESAYLRALECNPNFAEAHNNLGILLKAMGRQTDAETAYLRALELKPEYAEAHNNLGTLLQKANRLHGAEAAFLCALELKPDFSEAHFNLAILLQKTKRLPEAEAAYLSALEHNPDCPFALGNYLQCKQFEYNWNGFEATVLELLEGVDAGKAVSSPFNLMSLPSTPAQQELCAKIWVQEYHPDVQSAKNLGLKYAHDKIRLGYFSADFNDHPVAQLSAELFELHDRSKFEVFGFPYDTLDKIDPLRQRLSTAFDHFIDIRNLSDQEVAELVRRLEIDIAIDLTGHTHNSRTGIFALRLAPIQVNYLGYPGTMGASYIDYLIADPTIVPIEHQHHYSEKIAYLPDTYLVNDSKKQISERQFTRADFGLPEQGFVFCCFNNAYKITPPIFDLWMQILKQADGSVLWITGSNAQATQNLLNEAAKRGIAPERLVFAGRMDLLSDHLARYRLADIFLDTFYYNAHTTASDALWAGLPVLTYLGDTFAGRVAASLLNAVGLPELIARSQEEYKALALELASNPEKLADLKQKLEINRINYPLFNTSLFARHLEDAYTQMWQRHQGGFLPDHIVVQHRSPAAA